MKISGHRMRSTFDRYNIVSEEDLRAVVERTAAYVSHFPTERKAALPVLVYASQFQNPERRALSRYLKRWVC